MTIVSNWMDTVVDEICLPGSASRKVEEPYIEEEPVDNAGEDETGNTGLGKYWTIIAAGAGLFSDGYVNNSIGSAGTCLSMLYPKEYAQSPAQSNVASIAFVGTVVGQLFFGYVADYHSRKWGMIISTVILILFTILASGSWGAHNSIYGMLAALTAYRFFLGIGIGGEYPAGSVACAEASMALGRGHRNRWFVWFTNFMIDSGFVVSAFVPLVLVWICGKDHLTPVWRLTIGLGAIPPISLFFLRLKFKENKQFRKNNFKRTSVPYPLIIKFYWKRLLVVSLIWWIYDFSAYSFGIYSSAIYASLIPDNDIIKTFGWNTVFNLFYIPGSFLGAISADYFGPRLTLATGVGLQGIIAYIMSAQFENLSKHVAAFTVVFGIFTTLGEFGPGDCIGLICSKTSATSVRGQYYGIAAAIGKIGAFIGTKVFPTIEKERGLQGPFYVSASLCMFSCFLALFFLPPLTQDAVQSEDIRFREYLAANGFDVSSMGDIEFVEGQSQSPMEDESLSKKPIVASEAL